MAVGLRQFTARTGNGAGEPVLDTDNGEELVNVQPSVSVALGNRAPESPGTLYITTRQVVWLSDLDRTKGYAVDFLSLSLHAVSRDPEAYSSPCIYTQIETEDDEVEDEPEDSDSECSEVLDLSKIREMRLIPSDASQLDTLFQVLCECAELNPEPVEEEGHNWIFSADQLEDGAEESDGVEWNLSQNPANTIGHSNGHHDLSRNVLELQINDQRFEDADEMEEGTDSGHQQQPR
ncbi:chloride conductance regulatory protein ICln-like isoform X2 [Hibiscus syriacus]|uniref:chloride conductance regulatory protein ICln-like isoform X2 n=1 Tax=Hibiscus syriacus TaxID=106335 RepID=UPI001921E6C0|nr:chloride conductance regulatory protein ICln-like isoform X2 [Hibiscus syriacus]